MHYFTSKHWALSALVGAGLLAAMEAQAGGTINVGTDKSVSVGLAMRGSFSSVQDAAPNGTSRSHNFSLDSARLLLGGSLSKNIKGMLNTEKDIAGQGFQVIDANVQVELTPGLSVWAGRFLSPSDRANMAGPYYSLGGGYWSGIASRYGYNGGYIGRDDGVALVGSAMDGKLSYSFGAFEGNTAFKIAPVTVGTRTGTDSLMYAGRLQMDFWDAEPGYYGTGNYLGAKDILAVGVAFRSQGGGSVSATKTGDYSSYSVDFLMEKKNVGAGTLSLEAAYYDYDTDKVFLSEEGKAYSMGLGYLTGAVQPFLRYQKFAADNNIDSKKTDLGLSYIVDGYNAQLSGVYSQTKVTGTKSINALMATMQFQF